MWSSDSSLPLSRRTLTLSGLVLAALLCVSSRSPAQLVCPPTWNPPFDHEQTPGWPASFNAIHAALIPVTSAVAGRPGLVFVMDREVQVGNGAWTQRYAVIDPETQEFWNNTLTLPAGKGELFCAGHCWLPDGRLFMAGGNRKYPRSSGGGIGENFLGSDVAYIWDPTQPFGQDWTQIADLAVDRWYPTVTLLDDRFVMVSGGTEDTNVEPFDRAYNTYELYDFRAGQWVGQGPARLLPGPNLMPVSALGEYPRMHLLATGRVFMAGMFADACSVDPLTAAWTTPPWTSAASFRAWGSSVLFPNHLPGLQDVVAIIGGMDFSATVLSSVEYIDLKSGSPKWMHDARYDLNLPRLEANAVLLPDAGVLVVGGSSTDPIGGPETPVKQVEIFRNGAWTLDPQSHTPRRTYHSTAVLLPSGNVLSAGGESRAEGNSGANDYQLLSFDYVAQGFDRPEFAGAAPSPLRLGLTYSVGYQALPAGVTIQKVVLMRPCSITHHSDMDQRYVEAQILGNAAGVIRFQAPRTMYEAPLGYYMMFLVTNGGVPSTARFVQLVP